VFQPTDHNVDLSEEEFRLLRDLIHERFGLFFDDNQRSSVRTRLTGRLASLDLQSFEDYYHYLRFGPQRGDELQRMVTHLTNNETYFYREMPQLQVFAETVLREIKDAKAAGTDRTLRVLSAGCSTGEEAYTLAMMIYDSGQFFWNWDVQVIGMDVDQVALEKARRAVYHHNSFRSLSPAVKERHFVAAGGAAAQVKEPIRRLVRFRAGNIVDAASYMGLPRLDVIFCRNVLIYFSDAMILKVVRLFHDALVPGGYLFLGHAESLSRITDLFTPIRFQGAMIYRKEGLRDERPPAPAP
jgi:chemotaxis protein methyltransferase CheR